MFYPYLLVRPDITERTGSNYGLPPDTHLNASSTSLSDRGADVNTYQARQCRQTAVCRQLRPDQNRVAHWADTPNPGATPCVDGNLGPQEQWLNSYPWVLIVNICLRPTPFQRH